MSGQYAADIADQGGSCEYRHTDRVPDFGEGNLSMKVTVRPAEQ